MNLSTVIARIAVLVFLLAGPVLADDLFTVQINQFDSGETIQISDLQKKHINDLWLRRDGNTISLNAGIFPDRYHAGLLLTQLRHFTPHAQVISASMPSPEQWLPLQRHISLQDIGYEQPVLLQGVQPYHAIHFPWDSTMAIKGSYLKLDLRVSDVLKSNSTVTVLAEGIPLVSFLKKDLMDDKKVIIRLDPLQNIEIGGTLDIEISGSFRATEAYCVDMKSKSLWLCLDNTSRLQFTRKMPSFSVRHFFSEPAAKFCFVSFEENKDSIEAIAKMAGLIGSLAYSKHSRIQFAPYSLTGKNIFVGSFDNDITVLGNNLFITPNGSKLLTGTVFPALIFSKLNGTSAEPSAKEAVKDISFEMLGYDNRTTQGIGDLIFQTTFSGLQLGGWPEKMSGTIRYTHGPVLEDDRSFLRIRLNGVLLESREIFGDGGERILTFSIPSRAIQAQNNLEIVFSYYFYTEDCIGSYPAFEVSLNKDSFLSLGRYNPAPPLTFSNYPAIFKGKGALLLSKLSKDFYTPMVRLMEIQGYLQHAIPDIAITEAVNLETGKFDYGVMVMDPNTAQPFDPPVDLTQKLMITNPLSNRVLIHLETTESISALQTFYYDDKLPMLLYQQRNVSRSPLGFTTDLLSSHSRANVGIISDTEWHAMEIGRKIRVIYPDKKNMAYYWHKYRLIFFFLAGAGFLLFLFYVYHRLAKEK
ncbi:MAG: cellulose biosynthesis cyclic di-GMP-binding regulatory protein BcsB [Desulfobacterium sp.]|nr:cellulose biosynthesis cyclic di-GMP-binding regulatory protein BcsB [Desulfobacterium sp.]